jgi:hypothetical protein
MRCDAYIKVNCCSKTVLIFIAVEHSLSIMSQSEHCKYCQSLHGMEIPVFSGGSRSGAGLGDILRGLFRFLMPVPLRGISSFAASRLAGTQPGLSLQNTARAAIVPALSAAARSHGPTVSRTVSAIAPGLAGGTQRGGAVLFDSENGVPTTDKVISRYKTAVDIIGESPAPMRSRTSKKAHESGTHYNF